ncbi:putative 4-mercaptohistidine N1-methyltransferase [Rubellicoccus peritrichatus]|uniref:4-mercaptohistidine N1-methyltransferase n=1 Tax=Rubellicoccus peritrichatus TaxID=3080537 RepID=A0AAQ3LAL8_9BACT|nr:putative 4-mercaptohistidine N1-methyltransferase [Puniceicoccus sp. CR14]WOO39988.1 putative 4-mercaptohistidine N1-methyltransferase [Puniceicoccus sp. CR14]
MPENLYETDELLAQYLLLHFGTADEILPYAFGPKDALEFPARCVQETFDLAAIPSDARALDVGCSVGRSTFELAKHCKEVIGIDFSQSFIEAAQILGAKGFLDYGRKYEGQISLRSVAAVPEVIDRSRASFEVGDAQYLRDDLGQFDLVLACNLICRLPDPMLFLRRLPQLVKPGGQLVITTPFTWLEEYTPPENWLGGTAETGDSFNGLRSALETDFELMKTKDMPFIIRETARKFQWTVAQGSVWQKR